MYETSLLEGINYKEFWDMTLKEINYYLISRANHSTNLARLNGLAFNEPSKLPQLIEVQYNNILCVKKVEKDNLLIENNLRNYINNKKHFLRYKEIKANKTKGVD